MQIETPYLMFLGDVPDTLAAKTAYGIADWRPEWCVGQLRLPGCAADLGIPDLTLSDAVAKGCKTMVIGSPMRVVCCPRIGCPRWSQRSMPVSTSQCLHVRLGSIPEIAEAAERNGRQLHDVRHTSETFDTGKGTRRPGRRLLSVGTDCSVGKKYTVLAWSAPCGNAGSMQISRYGADRGDSSPGAASPSTRWWRISSPVPWSGSPRRRIPTTGT